MAEVDVTADGVVVRLARAEVDLLVRLCEGLAGRLRAGGDGPVIDRLAPAASRGDAEADAELRRLLRTELLDGRADRLGELAERLRGWAGSGDGGAAATLGEEAALGLLRGLNDIRLGLGAGIGIDGLERDRLDADDPRTLTLALMDRLASLQQRLVEALDG